MTTGRALKVWLVNQYAIPESAPGITRHATLTRLMEERQNVDTVIISGRAHYWNLGDAGYSTAKRFQTVDVGVAPANGVRRVLNMVDFAVRVLVKAARTPRRERPDVVLGSSPHLFGALAALIVARFFRVPFALEVRDLWPLSLVELMGMSRRHPLVLLMSGIERILYSSADVIFLVLPGSEAHVRSVCSSPPPMVRVPNGVDAGSIEAREQVARGATGPVTVLYAGAHGVPNALDTLIDAWALVEQDPEAPPMSLRLVGQGKEKAALDRMARSLGLTTVTFEDPISKEDIPALLEEADVLVITWRDSPLYLNGISPNKLYDYMAAARPVVIAVNTPINAVLESDGGLSVPPEDPAALAAALLSLARADPAERERMGRNGRDYVLVHHDLGAIADRMAQQLRDVSTAGGKR
ncbi:glycosyltransferase family 4 protein [Nocardioides conyzicola]|uniref:Glycosyltransferase family 4 protein n=1 Tax=Nocardioides conyzicola TaxID=1651781 RepID=A0ABP8XF76_9ACTN